MLLTNRKLPQQYYIVLLKPERLVQIFLIYYTFLIALLTCVLFLLYIFFIHLPFYSMSVFISLMCLFNVLRELIIRLVSESSPVSRDV